ncbi:MAG: hypothetical protein ACR2PB_00190, partial [Desulfocapsaceae bacterium]
LVRNKADLKSTILLSPHHGSATSNSFALLTEVSPEIMVFSSGNSGNMNFPAKETLTTADKLGISTLNTSEVGTIIIEINDSGAEYQLITANEPKNRYWRNG